MAEAAALARPLDFIDAGAVVGTHSGTHQFTVGQRRGLRLGVPAGDGQPRYVLSIEPTLFGDSALVREWGRIGSSGQRRSELFPQPSDAHLALDTWLKRKRRRGYQQRS